MERQRHVRVSRSVTALEGHTAKLYRISDFQKLGLDRQYRLALSSLEAWSKFRIEPLSDLNRPFREPPVVEIELCAAVEEGCDAFPLAGVEKIAGERHVYQVVLQKFRWGRLRGGQQILRGSGLIPAIQRRLPRARLARKTAVP